MQVSKELRKIFDLNSLPTEAKLTEAIKCVVGSSATTSYINMTEVARANTLVENWIYFRSRLITVGELGMQNILVLFPRSSLMLLCSHEQAMEHGVLRQMLSGQFKNEVFHPRYWNKVLRMPVMGPMILVLDDIVCSEFIIPREWSGVDDKPLSKIFFHPPRNA
jgi:hypothetical protein